MREAATFARTVWVIYSVTIFERPLRCLTHTEPDVRVPYVEEKDL